MIVQVSEKTWIELRNPELFLLMESGIQVLGTRNSTQRIRNPAKIKNQIPSSTGKESGIHSVECESKIPLDYRKIMKVSPS